MRYKLVVFCLVVLYTNLIASDTLNRYPKFIFDFTYSHHKMMFGNFSSEKNYENQSIESFNLNVKQAFSFNSQYHLTQKCKTKHQLYIGIGVNYSHTST